MDSGSPGSFIDGSVSQDVVGREIRNSPKYFVGYREIPDKGGWLSFLNPVHGA
jgi:hypothetical protein